MIIAANIRKLLEHLNCAYRVFQHKRVTYQEDVAQVLKFAPQQFLKVQVLADPSGTLLVVYPLGRKIDFAQLKLLLHRNLKILPDIKVNRIFNDCESGCWPAIGQVYGLEMLIDHSVRELPSVYFSSGCHNATIQMETAEYLELNARAKVLAFTQVFDLFAARESQSAEEQNTLSAQQLLLDTQSLPSLPGIARQILQLSVSSDDSIGELVSLVSQDPILQQQIILYTKNTLLQQQLESQHDPKMDVVIEHILGFDTVSHIALSVSAGRAFPGNTTPELVEFWRHAFYCAHYAKEITLLADPKLGLDPAISHLAGLFHNFGLLLFSQLFSPEYSLLKKWQDLNPKVSIAVLEKRLLGMGRALNIIRGGHAQLGEWLLRHWQLPDPICVITKEHHAANYTGPYAPYVKIIQLTNQLLREVGIGDGTLGGNFDSLLSGLGIDPEQAQTVLAHIKQGNRNLDQMVDGIPGVASHL